MKAVMRRWLGSKGLDPNSDLLQEIQRISTYASFVVLVLAPFMATFNIRAAVSSKAWAAIVIAHTLADLIIMGDSATRAISGYFDPNDKGERNVLVNKLQENIKNYFRSYFVFDLLSSIPVKCIWRIHSIVH